MLPLEFYFVMKMTDATCEECSTVNDGSNSKRRALSMRDDMRSLKKREDSKVGPCYEECTEILKHMDEADVPNDVFRQAIRKRDLSYVSEFLLNKNKGNMLNKLSCGEKQELSVLLLEFVDQPLRKEALETIKSIVPNVRDVNMFIRKLKERAVDFSRLVYIKGKIDYLRFMVKGKEPSEPEFIVGKKT